MKLVMMYNITLVENRRRAVRGQVIDRGLPTQRTDVEYEDLGWWIKLMPGAIAYYVGHSKPNEGFVEGASIKMTLEVV